MLLEELTFAKDQKNSFGDKGLVERYIGSLSGGIRTLRGELQDTARTESGETHALAVGSGGTQHGHDNDFIRGEVPWCPNTWLSLSWCGVGMVERDAWRSVVRMRAQSKEFTQDSRGYSRDSKEKECAAGQNQRE